MGQENNRATIHIPSALKLIGIIAGVWAILFVLVATLTYLHEQPNFSFFTTYLSDIGATTGWPQIIFNSGTLISAPIRYLVLVLIVLQLNKLGAGRTFFISILIIGLISTIGTIIMTAVPYSVSAPIHKLGIPLYFFGVVILQTIIGIKESSLKNVPNILAWLSFLVVVIFFIFATLAMLQGKGIVGRNVPVIWEWLAFFVSIVWLFAQSILLSQCSSET